MIEASHSHLSGASRAVPALPDSSPPHRSAVQHGRAAVRQFCPNGTPRPSRTYRVAVLCVAIALGLLLVLQSTHASSGEAAVEPTAALPEEAGLVKCCEASGERSVPLVQDPDAPVRSVEAIGQGLPTPASKWRFHGQHDPTRPDDVCDAAAQGDLEFLGAMVRHGLDIDIADAMGRTPLMCAQSGDVADFLLRQGADPNAADRDGYAVLHYHLWSDAALSLVPVLLEHGVAPQRSSPPLLRELAVRFIEWRQYHEGAILLEMLVCAGWDVDERDGHGATLLHVAAHNDNLPLAESVLRLGADPSLRDHEGRTAAAIAQELGSSRVLSRLLEAQELE